MDAIKSILIKVKGMTFTQAMQTLADGTIIIPESPARSEVNKGNGVMRKLLLTDRSETNHEIIRYLTDRGIDTVSLHLDNDFSGSKRLLSTQSVVHEANANSSMKRCFISRRQ